MIRHDPDPVRPDSEPQTVDRLRADIDRGLTGEKVPGTDPAAAPLGTDAEAAGAPPTPREIALEARSRNIVPPPQSPSGRYMPWLAGAAVLALVALVLAVL